MKYCLNSKCSIHLLKRADEVFVFQEDEDVLMDWVERMPDKGIVLNLNKGTVPDVKMYPVYQEKFADFIVCVSDFEWHGALNDIGIKWMWRFAVNTYEELRQLMALKPSRIIIGAPLTFDIKNVKEVVGDIELMMIPHKTGINYIPHKIDNKGIRSQWVRPEDVKLYDPYISTFDLSMEEPRQAEAFLHVYKENGEWPGNLNLLITGLNVDIDNRSISNELAEARIECGQRCLRTGTCHKCETEFAKCKLVKDIHNGKIKINKN